jgi:hypothetical protein
VKLVVHEPETKALRELLRSWPERVSSVVARVEVERVARRIGGGAIRRTRTVLSRIALVDLDEDVVQTQPGSTRLSSEPSTPSISQRRSHLAATWERCAPTTHVWAPSHRRLARYSHPSEVSVRISLQSGARFLEEALRQTGEVE